MSDAPSRRHFLIAGAAAGGALLIGFGLRDPGRVGDGSGVPVSGSEVALNAYLKLDAEGGITVLLPRAEMGQGVSTALPMLLAEELAVDVASVRVEFAPAGPEYANVAIVLDGLPTTAEAAGPLAALQRGATARVARWMGLQVTGGSTSVRDAWLPMREAGAVARELLLRAAGAKWGVERARLYAADGRVHDPRGGRTLGYADLAVRAARLPPDRPPALRGPAGWTQIGTSPRRLDGLAKVSGTARFGIDARPEGLLYAALALLPAPARRLTSADTEAARAMRGVQAVVMLPDGVAVVADNSWRARQAADAVRLSGEGGPAVRDEAELATLLDTALDAGEARVYEQRGAALGAADATTLDADYAVPFLAHACMEPLNCTARIDADACTLWLPTQAPELARGLAALTLGLSRQQVTVERTYLGGGFGRRAEMDVVRTALRVAQALPGRAVQVLWSREQDFAHDVFRPAARARLRARLGADGLPLALHVRLASDSVLRGLKGRLWAGLDRDGPDPTCVDGCIERPYALPRVQVEHVAVHSGIPVGFWRSVGFSQNVFFYESFVDEMALAAGIDALDYRRRLLGGHPRHLAVLERAARAAGWEEPLAPGRGRGIALAECFASIVAQVVEVSVSGDRLRVERVTCAIDCGTVVHPDQVRAQISGAIVFALSAALWGRIDLRDGAVQESNFDGQPLLRMPDMPAVVVELLDRRPAPPGGVGEPGVPPLAPALANALFAASGQRVRQLPITASGWRT